MKEFVKPETVKYPGPECFTCVTVVLACLCFVVTLQTMFVCCLLGQMCEKNLKTTLSSYGKWQKINLVE